MWIVCEFCPKWEFENVNFVQNEILKMWILSKMRFRKYEFCQKWNFEDVNFAKNKILKMWILWKLSVSICNFLISFASVCGSTIFDAKIQKFKNETFLGLIFHHCDLLWRLGWVRFSILLRCKIRYTFCDSIPGPVLGPPTKLGSEYIFSRKIPLFPPSFLLVERVRKQCNNSSN